MSRMNLTLVVSLLLPFLAIGCGPDAKDKRIAELTKENDQLKAELADRDARVNELTAKDEEAQKAVRDLNRELADARDRLARGSTTAAPPTVIEAPQAKGWIGMPGFDMISIPGEVLFDSGKATLRPAGRSTLDKIASDIRARYSDRDIYVFGHTDDEPIRKSGWKDNWQLGAERALTASRYLIQAGIPPSKVIQANCSEYRPRAMGTSANVRKENRRVEFYAVIKRSGGGTEIGSADAADTGTVAAR
jgi:chemotaxis protein MotB